MFGDDGWRQRNETDDNGCGGWWWWPGVVRRDAEGNEKATDGRWRGIENRTRRERERDTETEKKRERTRVRLLWIILFCMEQTLYTILHYTMWITKSTLTTIAAAQWVECGWNIIIICIMYITLCGVFNLILQFTLNWFSNCIPNTQRGGVCAVCCRNYKFSDSVLLIYKLH